MPEHPTLKQRQAWLHWYIWCLRMHKAETRRISGGVPLVVVVADGDRLLTSDITGLPADPLGPIHAPVYRALGRELNRHGHPIKDPESESRIARSLGVSRDSSLESQPQQVEDQDDRPSHYSKNGTDNHGNDVDGQVIREEQVRQEEEDHP